MRTVLPAALEPLGDLVWNLRWSWHPETQALFEAIDPVLWQESGNDPIRLLGSVPRTRLDELAADEEFLSRLHTQAENLERYLTGERWYQRLSDEVPSSIAYFSPEFGITAVLPQYSGGLGILAGDHLKTASDLGVPIIGVGLLYRHGYFRQTFSRDGWQLENYPVLDPDGLPLSLLRNSDNSPAGIDIALPDGVNLHARIWVAQIGRVPLLLLDSDVETNAQSERDITDRLYGGNSEHRLRQEILLGIGGVRAIRRYCEITGTAAPEVFHTNEGHAGFFGVERVRELVEAGLDHDAALEVSRAGTVFTTHTPVPAGIDRFPKTLIEQYLGQEVLALGSEDFEGGDPEVFNMAVMGFRLAQRANGVSQLHGEVSREMFGGLWPNFDAPERPIGSITNGVHAPTWVASEVVDLARAHGANLSDDDAAAVFGLVEQVPAGDIWSTKRALREKLVIEARQRLHASWLKRGATKAELGWIDSALDPDVLTIGFARRAASYKRLTLLLSDPERLKWLLNHPERPVQLIMAGKAHPADDGGKKLIQAIVALGDDPELRGRVVYLPNYDIAMAQKLYPGCDVWLNNPLRPYEACGTSGMKAALNGGLNLSILDGWWDEWYDGSNGWAIPSADGVEDVDRRDDLEAAALYDLIETEVAPRFYDHDDEGVPGRWIEMVRHTLRSLGPKVIADRMLADYVEQLYRPAAVAARSMNGDFAGAKALADWKRHVIAVWPQVRIDHIDSTGIGDAPEVGGELTVNVYVSLGELSPDDVAVQVLHGRVKREDDLVDPVITTLAHVETYEAGRHRYEGVIALAAAGPFGYTARIVPRNERLASEAELSLVAVP